MRSWTLGCGSRGNYQYIIALRIITTTFGIVSEQNLAQKTKTHGLSGESLFFSFHHPHELLEHGASAHDFLRGASQASVGAMVDKAPADSGESSAIRHDEETADREVDLVGRKLEIGLKPGLKYTLQSPHDVRKHSRPIKKMDIYII